MPKCTQTSTGSIIKCIKTNTDPLFEYKAQNAERRFYTDNAF